VIAGQSKQSSAAEDLVRYLALDEWRKRWVGDVNRLNSDLDGFESVVGSSEVEVKVVGVERVDFCPDWDRPLAERVRDTKVLVVPLADFDGAHDFQALGTTAPVEPLSGAAAAVRQADCFEILLRTDP
jgi:hypothetical protein